MFLGEGEERIARSSQFTPARGVREYKQSKVLGESGGLRGPLFCCKRSGLRWAESEVKTLWLPHVKAEQIKGEGRIKEPAA